jgi:hypothetical protein
VAGTLTEPTGKWPGWFVYDRGGVAWRMPSRMPSVTASRTWASVSDCGWGAFSGSPRLAPLARQPQLLAPWGMAYSDLPLSHRKWVSDDGREESC